MSTPSTGFLSKPVPFSAAKGGVSLDWVYRAWLSKTKVNQFTKKITCFKNDPKFGGPTKNLPEIRTNILNLQVLSILPCGHPVETNPFAWSVSLGWWRSLTWPRSASVLVPLSIFYFPWHLGVMVSPRWSHDPTNLYKRFRGPTQLQWEKRGVFATLKKWLTSSSDNILQLTSSPFFQQKWRDWNVFSPHSQSKSFFKSSEIDTKISEKRVPNFKRRSSSNYFWGADGLGRRWAEHGHLPKRLLPIEPIKSQNTALIFIPPHSGIRWG